ncbi:MAG: hypothetical protein R3D55_00690 [Chloroflexota bacterium]
MPAATNTPDFGQARHHAARIDFLPTTTLSLWLILLAQADGCLAVWAGYGHKFI